MVFTHCCFEVDLGCSLSRAHLTAEVVQELVERLAQRAYARIKEPPDVQPHQMAVL